MPGSRSGLAERRGRGRKALESNPPVGLHFGEEALARVERLTYQEGYEDDGYVLSSAAALKEPFSKGSPPPFCLQHIEFLFSCPFQPLNQHAKAPFPFNDFCIITGVAHWRNGQCA